MTISEDPLYQKYKFLHSIEREMRQPYIEWVNTQTQHFTLTSLSECEIVEFRRVVYAGESYDFDMLNPVISPYIIVEIILKTSHGFTRTIKKIPFRELGDINKQMLCELQYFIEYRTLLYESAQEFNKKYQNQYVTDGNETILLNKITYYSSCPKIYYLDDDSVETSIDPRKFKLCDTL